MRTQEGTRGPACIGRSSLYSVQPVCSVQSSTPSVRSPSTPTVALSSPVGGGAGGGGGVCGGESNVAVVTCTGRWTRGGGRLGGGGPRRWSWARGSARSGGGSWTWRWSAVGGRRITRLGDGPRPCPMTPSSTVAAARGPLSRWPGCTLGLPRSGPPADRGNPSAPRSAQRGDAARPCARLSAAASPGAFAQVLASAAAA